MKDLFDIEEKNILITGGTGVLGSEWSKYLAAQGANLIAMGKKLLGPLPQEKTKPKHKNQIGTIVFLIVGIFIT